MHAFWPHFGPFLKHVPKTGYLVFRKKLLLISGGVHFGGMSQKRGFLFSENKVGAFWGVHCTRFGGILGHFGAFWGVLCPKNGVPCFPKKAFAKFRGCPFRRHVPKTGYLVFGKQGWPFLGGAFRHRIIHCRFHMHQIASTNHRMWCCCGYPVFSATGQSHARWQTPPLCTERIS